MNLSKLSLIFKIEKLPNLILILKMVTKNKEEI